jgi:hypothetical protein
MRLESLEIDLVLNLDCRGMLGMAWHRMELLRACIDF